MSDYYRYVTPDPNLAAVLRDRDIWKHHAQELEADIKEWEDDWREEMSRHRRSRVKRAQAEQRVQELEDGIREAGHHDTCAWVLTDAPCSCPMRLLSGSDDR